MDLLEATFWTIYTVWMEHRAAILITWVVVTFTLLYVFNYPNNWRGFGRVGQIVAFFAHLNLLAVCVWLTVCSVGTIWYLIGSVIWR